MQTNPKDPLLINGTDPERKLFEAVVDMCKGCPAQWVYSAAVNLIIHFIRIAMPTRKQALDEFDHVMTKAREILANHYVPDGSSRRSIFAFDQTVHAELADLRTEFPKTK